MLIIGCRVQEAMFEMAVRQDVYEERQNQLRWQVKLGEDQISPEARAEIINNRNQAWINYKVRVTWMTCFECGARLRRC